VADRPVVNRLAGAVVNRLAPAAPVGFRLRGQEQESEERTHQDERTGRHRKPSLKRRAGYSTGVLPTTPSVPAATRSGGRGGVLLDVRVQRGDLLCQAADLDLRLLHLPL